MKTVGTDSPYVEGAGRVLTQRTEMIVEGPVDSVFGRPWVASAWSGLICIGWRRGESPREARFQLLLLLSHRYGIVEEK